jgi:hypothetical protein
MMEAERWLGKPFLSSPHRGGGLLLFLTLLASLVSCQSPDAESTLIVTIIEEEGGKPVPVRVRVTDERGEPVAAPANALALPGSVVGVPDEALAVMYGRNDSAEGFSLQPDGAFYVDGTFRLDLDPGRYEMTVSKGYEYRRWTSTVDPPAGGGRIELTVPLSRWIDMPSLGWFSADDHIHLRRSPREDPLILRWIAAEDVHVGNILQMGDFWSSTYFTQYAFGEAGRYGEGGNLLVSGQEDPRTDEIGHTISLAADGFVRFSSAYYLYDRVFDEVRRRGGLTGYAHQAMSFHGYRGLTLDLPRNKIDFLELLQFCVQGGPLLLQHYYHYLDLGFPLTVTAGSDFPWCGRGPAFGTEEGCSRIGDARFYTYLGEEFSFESWLRGLREGRTFVTSGPMLLLRVDDRLPGERLRTPSGSSVGLVAEAFGVEDEVPLRRLEVVGHGKVIASTEEVISLGEGRQRMEIRMEVPIERGLWLAARCEGGATQYAHTTPVYVETERGGFMNPETAPGYLDLSESYLREIESVIAGVDPAPNRQAFRYREPLEERIRQVRGILDELRAELRTLP